MALDLAAKKQRDREYYLLNKEKIIKRSMARRRKYKTWRTGEPGQRKRCRLWYLKNKDAAKRQVIEWRIKNLTRYRQLSIVREARRRARKANASGTFTLSGWYQRVSYYGWRCVYCSKILTIVTITMDHRIPLSRGGSNWLSNLVPACVSCNCSKNTKTPKEFVLC